MAVPLLSTDDDNDGVTKILILCAEHPCGMLKWIAMAVATSQLDDE